MVKLFRKHEATLLQENIRTVAQKIVGITANYTAELNTELIVIGFDSLYPKPIKIDTVLEIVRAHLASRGQT